MKYETTKKRRKRTLEDTFVDMGNIGEAYRIALVGSPTLIRKLPLPIGKNKLFNRSAQAAGPGYALERTT